MAKQIHQLTQQLTLSDADKFPMQVTSSLLTKYIRADAIKSYIGIGAGGMYTALTSTVAVGATSVVLDTIPVGIPTKQYWVVIDPFHTSSQCEVRKVTARSSNTVTIAALTYQHLVDAPIMIIWEPVIHSAWFYCLGDDSTNNYTALTRMLSNARAEGIGLCMLASGVYQVGNTVNIPTGVTLRGYGVRLTTEDTTYSGTWIKAATGFSDTNLITMGPVPATGNVFDCRLENMGVECSNLATNGIYSESLNELSGLSYVRVRDATTTGIKLDGSSNPYVRNYLLEHIYVTFPTTPGGTEVGVYIDGGETSQRYMIRDLTVTATGGQIADGVRLGDYKGGGIDGAHFENCVDGVHAGTDTKFCRATIENIVGNSNVDNLVHIGSWAGNHVTCINLNDNNATNLVVDDRNSATVLGTELNVPFYTTSKFYAMGPGHRTNYDLYYQDNVAANQAAVQLQRVDHATAPALHAHQIVMHGSGSVVEIWVRLSAARTAGTLTLTLRKNSAAQAMTVVIDGTNDQNNYTFAVQGTYNFVRYDRLDLTITTDAAWLPVTADLRAGIVTEA